MYVCVDLFAFLRSSSCCSFLEKDIGLLGRDKILLKHIVPRLKAGKGFVIVGKHGVGKTALLEWAHHNAEGKKSLVTVNMTAKEFLTKICEDWGL